MADGDLGRVAAGPRFARAFRFQVKLFLESGGDGATPVALGDGGFQECAGLEVEMDAKEVLEGGRNDGLVRMIGRAKYQPLVLKRGMLSPKQGAKVNGELWAWLQGIVEGKRPVARYGGKVDVLEPGDDTVVATWAFRGGLPAKLVGPRLDAKTGEIAIEELHIVHEGLRLEVPRSTA